MTDDPTIKLKSTRDPARVSIRVGAKSMGTLARSRVEELGITPGEAWSDELAERVSVAMELDKAQRYALNALARRPLSEGQMRDKLRQRGHGSAAIEQIVSALVERGYLDDEAFGRSAIEAERARKPAGPQLLRYKLMQKKLSSELIDRLVNEADEAYDGVDVARQMAEKKLATSAMQKLDPAARKRRLWGQLARRGFGPDVIRSALEGLDGLDEWAE